MNSSLDDCHLKAFVEAHDIPPCESECDHVQQVLAAAGLKVLLVEKTWHQDE